MKLQFNKKCTGEKELFIGIFAVLAGLFLLTVKDKNTGFYTIYPKFVFGALIAVGCFMIGKACFQPADRNQKGKRVQAYEIIILALLLLIRPLMTVLGIYSTLFLICTAIGVLLEQDRSAKTIGALAAFNLALSAVLYVAFTILLKVNMPRGLLI